MKTLLKVENIDIENLKNTFTKKGLSFISESISNSQRYTKDHVINLNINTSHLSLENVLNIKEVADEFELVGLQRKASSYINALTDVDNAKMKTTQPFEKALIDFIVKKTTKGLLFYKERDGSLNPLLITNISYHPPQEYRKEYVSVATVSNDPRSKGIKETSFDFNSSDIKGRRISEILKSKGLSFETQELLDLHEEKLKTYKDIYSDYGSQFVATGKLNNERFSENEPEMNKRIKLINNNQKSEALAPKYLTNKFWKHYIDVEKYSEIPFIPYIPYFNLHSHEYQHVISNHVEKYKYNPGIKSQLILPPEHSSLLDILVNDMEFIQEDIVDGKSGGTVVLALGSAGLGKTLTAEAYSEIVGKPLYRVHSGQLGQNAEDIEKNLRTILNRSESWGSILLIDEADVYIRKRDNSMEHNAVVASFLRQLEYFSGLLFLTSNREEDIDDAIRSRCSATIRYQTPKKPDLIKIWQVLSTNYNAPLSDKLIVELSNKYPTCSGRDVKELLKLATKYHRNTDHQYDMELFELCALFRGL